MSSNVCVFLLIDIGGDTKAIRSPWKLDETGLIRAHEVLYRRDFDVMD
jgi:hypothetical protein